jgi:hypothetical protein
MYSMLYPQPKEMSFADIAAAFKAKAVNPWTYLDLEDELKFCRTELSKECDLPVIGTVSLGLVT